MVLSHDYLLSSNSSLSNYILDFYQANISFGKVFALCDGGDILGGVWVINRA